MINGLKKWIRILVGVFYILSGLLKLMDPVGTGLIVEAYFRFIHLYDCMGVAKGLGVFIGAFETIIGIAAVLCLLPKFMRIVFLFVQAAFTLISLALVIWNPQMHCGCFGEAIHLTHWETFSKNIAMLILITFAYFPLHHKHNASKSQLAIFLLALISITLFSSYSWHNVPIIDFTDYKPGTHIVSPMEYRELSSEERKSYKTIPMMGIDESHDSITLQGKLAIISVYNLFEKDDQWRNIIKQFHQLNKQGYKVVLLIASIENKLENITPLAELKNSIFLTDKTTAMTLNRKNGGITFLENGVIIKKAIRVTEEAP